MRTADLEEILSALPKPAPFQKEQTMPDFRSEAEQRCMDAVLGIIEALQPVGKIDFDAEPQRFSTQKWETKFKKILADLGAEPTSQNVAKLESTAQMLFKSASLFDKVWNGELNV
jgi:hypothetical protein